MVDPKNPNIVFVAALATRMEPVRSRRLSLARWRRDVAKVLFKSDDVRRHRPRVRSNQLAVIMRRCGHASSAVFFTAGNGPGSGISSKNGGTTWQPLTSACYRELGRIGIAVAPTIAIASTQSLMQRRWLLSIMTQVRRGPESPRHRIWGRGWLLSKVTGILRPRQRLRMNTSVYKSLDAVSIGRQLRRATAATISSALTILRSGPDDCRQRSGRCRDRGRRGDWSSWYNQSTAQLYTWRPTIDFLLGNRPQQIGAVGTPTRSSHSEISMHDWSGVCAVAEVLPSGLTPAPEILFGGSVTLCNVHHRRHQKRFT